MASGSQAKTVILTALGLIVLHTLVTSIGASEPSVVDCPACPTCSARAVMRPECPACPAPVPVPVPVPAPAPAPAPAGRDPCWFPASPQPTQTLLSTSGQRLDGVRLDGSTTPFLRCSEKCGRNDRNELIAHSCDVMARQYVCSNRGIRHPVTRKCHCHRGWKGADCSEEHFDPPAWKTRTPAVWRASGEQDRLITEVFFPELREGGRFLEAGATVSSSNTAYFEQDLGWQGACVTPLAKTQARVAEKRPGCTLVPKCLWDAAEELRLTNTESEGNAKVVDVFDRNPGALEQYLKTHTLKTGEEAIVTVPCDSLEGVMRSTGFTHMNYVSLDVEGAELEVLRRFPFGKDLEIDVLSVEMGSTRYASVAHLLLANEFEFVGYDTQRNDAIYVSASFKASLSSSSSE